MTHRFYPWTRRGLGAGAQGTVEGGRRSLTVNIHLEGDDEALSGTIDLVGPGDATGIDPRLVVRCEPRPGTTDFEPNYFAAVEFDRSDLPWLLSPLGGDQEALPPWLVLVVVEDRAGVRLVHDARRSTFDLVVGGDASAGATDAATPREELPDLSESHAWAHVQVTGADSDAEAHALLEEDGDRCISRLLAPRRLRPNASYIACVVPAYRGGADAGRGLDVDPATALQPSWSPSDPSVCLPVYHHWRFSTGSQGDFESLAERLQRAEPPQEMGSVAVDGSRPGGGLPDRPGVTFGIEGALSVPGRSTPWNAQERRQYADDLERVLEAGVRDDPDDDPIVAPPIYGAKHVGRDRLPPSGGPPWLRTVNLDPRHRAVAGLGAQIVRDRQEEFMTAAWRQVGEVLAANQLLRQMQLATETAKRTLERRLKPRSPEGLFLVTATVHARLRGGIERTILSSEASLVTTPALRRALRPGTSITRGTETKVLVDGLVVGAARGDWTRRATLRDRRARAPPAGTPWMTDARVLRSGLARARGATAERLREHEATLLDVPRRDTVRFHVEATARGLLEQLDPARTLAELARARIDRGAPDPRDPLEPIQAAPVIPLPASTALAASYREMLLPGVSGVPRDSVMVLKANRKFVEAFLLGMNHEMMQELLWRGYPTDQRGSVFRQFWDASVSLPPDPTEADVEARRDILPIHAWRRALGGNAVNQTDHLVLLIRGDLLKRYPDAMVYAVRGEHDGTLGPGVDPVLPVFRGTIDPDITYLGFELEEAQARGASPPTVADPGYYFVLQEQPTAPRFGLDENDDPGPLTLAAELAWGHVSTDGTPYVPLAPPLEPEGGFPDTDAEWGRNAAHMASLTWQQPFRVYVHARHFLKEAP